MLLLSQSVLSRGLDAETRLVTKQIRPTLTSLHSLNIQEGTRMHKIQFFFVYAAFAASVLAGCAYALAPVTGLIYSDVKGPITVTSQTESSKTGTAECSSLFGLFASGDASIEA